MKSMAMENEAIIACRRHDVVSDASGSDRAFHASFGIKMPAKRENKANTDNTMHLQRIFEKV